MILSHSQRFVLEIIFFVLARCCCYCFCYQTKLFHQVSPWGGATRKIQQYAQNFDRKRVQTNANSNNNNNNGDGRTVDDWRAFRAKLVFNERASQDNNTSTSSSTSSSSSSSLWAYDTGLLVEKGSIVVSRMESSLGCHDLRQPYFCKCVILIVEHDEEFTQGIILNRPSNLFLNDDDIIYLDDEGLPLLDECNDMVSSSSSQNDEKDRDQCKHSWRMFCGGDLASIHSESPMIVCLHNRTSEIAQSVSDEILPGVYLTSQLAARGLVEGEDEATPEDFYTFFGFCGWDPGQLEKEVKRGSWYIVSTATETFWKELDHLRDSAYDPRNVGLDMWEGIIDKIGKKEEVGQRGSFPELMLKEWATEMLVVSNEENATYLDDSDIYRALNAAGQKDILPGNLLRASYREVSPFLLQDQFLHKSTLLLLQDTESFSAAFILNLPTTDLWLLDLPDGSTIEFIIRYGGPGGDEESPPVWLHNNEILKRNKVGKPVNPAVMGGIWTCAMDQVVESLSLGLAVPEDFILIQGFCVWEKEAESGGIIGQIRAGNLEPIGNLKAQSEVWSLLQTQKRLEDENTLTENMEIGTLAWYQGIPTALINKNKDSRLVFGTNVTVSQLADDALEVWMKIFLLGDTEYYY